MTVKISEFDSRSVLSGLKDFQRQTAEYVFRRMYLDDPPALRFLIADEVGLGKTHVAKGVIAKVIEHLRTRVRRIDVLYICSNTEIAKQNLNRLNVLGDECMKHATRITLLPKVIRDIGNNKVNFVSFTPGTSFNLRSAMGIGDERVVLYELLDQAWDFRSGWGTGPRNVLRGFMVTEHFQEHISNPQTDVQENFDKQIVADFCRALSNEGDLKKRFSQLCEKFSYDRKHVPGEERDEQKKIIGELRHILARVCLKSLEPDLIILDEFQRFKNLLDEDDEASLLAQELFSYADSQTKARVLLLSATPYKMYTLHDEANDENHYEDFKRTVRFLMPDEAGRAEFDDLLHQSRIELFRSTGKGMGRFKNAKAGIEQFLKQIMVRTERLAVSDDRAGMLEEKECADLGLNETDVLSYLDTHGIMGAMEEKMGFMEYWKSAPFLLNFMDDYLIKQNFNDKCNDNAVVKAVQSGKTALFPENEIDEYRSLAISNPRLRGLMTDVLNRGQWKLLWIPPSLPYYQPEGVFKDLNGKPITKRLLFSSWKVVPKTVSVMLSYEVERRIHAESGKKISYLAEDRKRVGQLLHFTRSKGRLSDLLHPGRSKERLTGLPLLALLYPSMKLAEIGDPLRIIGKHNLKNPLLSQIHDEVEGKIRDLLSCLRRYADSAQKIDESWYWLAPFLLDSLQEEESVDSWFQVRDKSKLGVKKLTAGEDEDSAWSEHVEQAQETVKNLLAEKELLGRMPADLAHVLTKIAIGGWGNSAIRSLFRVSSGSGTFANDQLRLSATRISYAFLSLFNSPEATLLINSQHSKPMDSDKPYWEQVLEYGLDGNLQSVLDEYAHILMESLGVRNHTDDSKFEKISEAMGDALRLRVSNLGVDMIEVGHDRLERKTKRMRTHFAMRYGDEKSDEGDITTRAGLVQAAFNSPFWPFVLITTSVGQEGLDFHHYCHAVVHWNIPSNPVDFEQREGRVHRFKGHAIRKNLALHYGLPKISIETRDPWEYLFDKARKERPAAKNDLEPYWIFYTQNGCKIERYIPSLPLSREKNLIKDLKRSQAAYRMVFGQPRQEDLVEYLTTQMTHDELLSMIHECTIDLSPKTSK